MEHINLKLGEINNLADARFAAGIGANFIGFNLTPAHPQYVPPDRVQEMIEWVQGPMVVCEWDEALTDIIVDTAERLQADYIQLNHLQAGQIQELSSFQVVQNLVVKEETGISDLINQINSVESYIAFFMLSFENESLQNGFLQSKAGHIFVMDLCRDFPTILNFSFTRKNILELLEKYSPFGINLKANRDARPGHQDFESLNELVDLLQQT